MNFLVLYFPREVLMSCSHYLKRKTPCKRTQHCWPTTPNIVGCYMLRPFAHPVACCWMLLLVVAQSLKLVKLFSQQLPTFLLFRDRWSVAQQCWIRLQSSSNIVGARHAHYAWIAKTYGLYSSHDALQVPSLLGVVTSVCTPLPTRTEQLPTLLAQQCWGLLRPFARSLSSETHNLQRVYAPPGGGTPLHRRYRYVRRQRVCLK